jgi:hypothetical protein
MGDGKKGNGKREKGHASSKSYPKPKAQSPKPKA